MLQQQPIKGTQYHPKMYKGDHSDNLTAQRANNVLIQVLNLSKNLYMAAVLVCTKAPQHVHPLSRQYMYPVIKHRRMIPLKSLSTLDAFFRRVFTLIDYL